jgi:hypothetical protein
MNAALCDIENELRDIDNMLDVFAGQVSICKEYGSKGTGIGFGEFLLYEGKIDAYELENALHYQNLEHVALGVLAVQEKLLNEQQLCDVMDCQRARGGLLGEIAIELGFLNEEDVDALLKMQGDTHIKIGEVLVLFGAISRNDMESRLQDFHASV